MKSSRWKSIWPITILILLATGADSPEVHTFRITTKSMEPTLKKGEIIRVRIIPKGSNAEFKRGQLVAVSSPENRATIYARRIVGIPGDRIQVKTDAILLNGTPVNEPYATWTEPILLEAEPHYKERLRELFDVGPVTVPPDTVYVLCDNRLDSPDSRKYGPLSIQYVVGFVLTEK